MRRLPDDVCRCHDGDCPRSRVCLRWIQRNTGGLRTPHDDSLFPFAERSVLTDECPSWIEVDEA